jgi:molybdopterin-guanine dinucleotide biosynthesis protein
MKIVFQVAGPGSVGKSTSIRLAYEQLRDKHADAVVVPSKATLRKEVQAILKINGKLVGIESRGDNAVFVKAALKLFAKQGCAVIVCATRTRGETDLAVQDFATTNGFKVVPLEKAGVATAEHSAENTKFAKKIAMEVLAAVGL